MTAKISIRSTEIGPDGRPGEEAIASVSLGETEARQGKLRLTYPENLAAEGEEADLTRVTLLASPGKVMMRREGAVSATMVFEAGQPRRGSYGTAYGALPFVLRTREVAVAGDPAEGRILLDYSLSIPGSGETRRRMEIAWEASPC